MPTDRNKYMAKPENLAHIKPLFFTLYAVPPPSFRGIWYTFKPEAHQTDIK